MRLKRYLLVLALGAAGVVLAQTVWRGFEPGQTRLVGCEMICPGPPITCSGTCRSQTADAGADGIILDRGVSASGVSPGACHTNLVAACVPL